MATAPTRIYVVKTLSDGTEDLVRAANSAAAKRHISGPDYLVHVATQGDLERLLGEGHQHVQDANGAAEPEVRGT